MAPKPRKQQPNMPRHIGVAKLPKGVYWDASGRGRWYMFDTVDGRKRRRTVAGPTATLADLHAIAEQSVNQGTVEWLCEQFEATAKFRARPKSTRNDYIYSRKLLCNYRTNAGSTIGKSLANKLRNTHLQRMIDKLEGEGTPTKANKLLRYSRMLFRWALNRGLVTHNPAVGLEAATERPRQRYPSTETYTALLRFVQSGAALRGRAAGSLPPYLPWAMEIGYLCRLRGIETITLTEAHATDDGLRTNRRKGSRDNIVQWTPRLRAAWDAAVAHRRAVFDRRKRPELLRPQDRTVFVGENGEPLAKSSLDSAWQRMIQKAMKAGVITEETRFSLHDLKRKGGTDTVGTRAEKQDALGVSEAMMKVYDKSVPTTKPSA
ncbi:site-specific integrase [Marilutibacter alkalisoli]|uniref:Integrase n=1 Tax=Marilutibacter alkalisoli TaxID=2591633 RepID=A0A514BU01_9GAMM|nr:integrase [Lysobacter alkalisoli]QDH70888.1 integrase [Lysobacter alkalisoli]